MQAFFSNNFDSNDTNYIWMSSSYARAYKTDSSYPQRSIQTIQLFFSHFSATVESLFFF